MSFRDGTKRSKYTVRSESTKASLLPDPQSSSSKRRAAKNTSKLFISLQELDLFGHEKKRILKELSCDQKISWLIQKYGWCCVSSIGSVLNSLPCALTETQKSSFLLSEYRNRLPDSSLDDQCVITIATFLQEECLDFVACLPRTELILSPPLSECPSCDRRLVSYHQCSVKVYTFSGVTILPKVTLRCKHCKLLFGYSQFGNKEQLGFRYYTQSRPYVEVSDTVFVERMVVELQCSLA